MDYMELHHILYELQHGFHHSRCCQAELISIVHQEAEQRDNNFSHSKLDNLNNYDIHGMTLQWIMVSFPVSTSVGRVIKNGTHDIWSSPLNLGDDDSDDDSDGDGDGDCNGNDDNDNDNYYFIKYKISECCIN